MCIFFSAPTGPIRASQGLAVQQDQSRSQQRRRNGRRRGEEVFVLEVLLPVLFILEVFLPFLYILEVVLPFLW